MTLYFEIIQLGGVRYLWRLRDENKVFARSQAIESKEYIENEVDKLQERLGLDIPVVVSER